MSVKHCLFFWTPCLKPMTCETDYYMGCHRYRPNEKVAEFCSIPDDREHNLEMSKKDYYSFHKLCLLAFQVLPFSPLQDLKYPRSPSK